MWIKRNVVKLGCIWIGAVILIAGALLSCSDGCGDDSSSRSSFWVLDFTKEYLHIPSAWYQIEVTKKAETARAVVYVDKNETQVTESIAEILVQEFENSIYSKVTQNFAHPLDVDGNGKTILVVLEGRFSMVGNMPFAKLVFRASDGKNYEVAPSEVERFKTMQGTRLRIECLAGRVVLETADKRYSRRVYFIKDIKIRDGEGR
jgi:hypothetical protein